MVGDVRLLQAQTLYARLGDLVAYVSLALLAATWVVGRRVAGFRRHSGEGRHIMAVGLDELVRRYQALRLRASELRRYL